MLFTYLSLAALSLLLRGLFFSCHKQGLLSSCSVRAPYCRGSSCCGARAPGCTCFNDCGTWAPQLQLPGSRARAQQLWHTDLVGPWLVGSSHTRTRTHTHIHTHTHTHTQWNIIQPQKRIPFAATWKNLKTVILNEVSQTEKDKYHMTSLICGI